MTPSDSPKSIAQHLTEKDDSINGHRRNEQSGGLGGVGERLLQKGSGFVVCGES